MMYRACLLVDCACVAGLVIALPQAADAGWFRQRHRVCSVALSPCPVVPIESASTPVPAAEEAIQQLLNDQVAAWNRGDLAGFMKGYWSSPDLTFYSGNNKTRGWQATLERYVKRYRADGKEMGQLTFRDIEVEMLGADNALVRGRWQLVLSKEEPGGLFTLVCKRTADGWRIIHDHTSS